MIVANIEFATHNGLDFGFGGFFTAFDQGFIFGRSRFVVVHHRTHKVEGSHHVSGVRHRHGGKFVFGRCRNQTSNGNGRLEDRKLRMIMKMRKIGVDQYLLVV